MTKHKQTVQQTETKDYVASVGIHLNRQGDYEVFCDWQQNFTKDIVALAIAEMLYAMNRGLFEGDFLQLLRQKLDGTNNIMQRSFLIDIAKHINKLTTQSEENQPVVSATNTLKINHDVGRER